MEVKTVVTGYLEENCYLLIKDGYCLVVDPGDDYEKIKKELSDLKVLGVLITHGHFDHVGALSELLDDYNVSVYDFKTCEEKEYQVGPFIFSVIFNPGHSKDSISFYFKSENMMFVGDFIFEGSIGRCDLDGSSISEMKKSLEMIKRYPNEIILYPGHGDFTSLEDEKMNNPYLK